MTPPSFACGKTHLPLKGEAMPSPPLRGTSPKGRGKKDRRVSDIAPWLSLWESWHGVAVTERDGLVRRVRYTI